MTRVYLGLGSNSSPEHYLGRAIAALRQQFCQVELSPVYESSAVGFAGDNFLNLVVGIDTTLRVGELHAVLRDIENANDRDRSAPRFSGRTLDIDILTFADACGIIDGVSLPREEIFTNAFVLLPFSELAPNLIPPGNDLTLAQLWQGFTSADQTLWRVAKTW